MVDTTFTAGTVVASTWLNDINDRVYNGKSQWNGELINVKDPTYGAVGDGVTDDTAAIQAAVDTGRAVFFPNPTTFYKTTAAINLGYSSRLVGDNSVRCIIRRTDGSGRVFEFAAVNENSSIENLRIGGAGCTGIGLVGGGYANYVSTLALRDVHFERDLTLCIDANLIYAKFSDSTFGYFVESAADASHRHIKSWFDGSLFTNLNTVDRCKFFYGAAAQASVDLNAGALWRFRECDWTLNGRMIKAANLSGLTLDQCYSEQNVHATSLIDLATARTRTRIVGGQHGNDGGTMPFVRYGDDTPLLLEDLDITTHASGYVLENAGSGLHTVPSHGRVKVRDVRVQGNSSDPLITADSLWSQTLEPKFWLIFDMSGAGTIVAASDPGINKGTDNGTGDWNINLPHPAAASASEVCVMVTGQASECRGHGITTGSSIRVRAWDQANPPAAVDDIVQIVVWGK